MQRQVIKFQLDVPVTVRLDQGPEGKEKPGQYGVDFQYTVNQDSGVMWLPGDARAQLIRSGAQAGDDVQICKSMRGRMAVWSVQVVPDTAPEPAPIHRTNGATAIKQMARVAEKPNGASQTHPMEDRLVKCFTLAAAAVWRAHREIVAMGIEMEPPNWEDVRACGISVFIEVNKNGGGK